MVKPFVRTASRVLLETPIFRLREDIAQHPGTGYVGRYYVLENPDWVNIVPVTPDGRIVLVRQWRHGSARVELEIPAGLIEKGEEPVDAAKRELMEETGYVPARAMVIGRVAPNAAYQQNTCYSVLAEDCRLEGATKFDPGEDIEVLTATRAEVAAWMRDGTFQNSMVFNALFFWLDRQGKVSWD